MWNKITFKSVVLGWDFIQLREMIIYNIWISHTITTACVEVREILVWLNRRRSKSLGCVYLIYLVPRVMCPLLLSHVTLISHIITQQVSASHPWINYNNKKETKLHFLQWGSYIYIFSRAPNLLRDLNPWFLWSGNLSQSQTVNLQFPRRKSYLLNNIKYQISQISILISSVSCIKEKQFKWALVIVQSTIFL